MKTRLLDYLFPVLWMGVIFFLSSQPVLPGASTFWQDFIFKKLAHISVYAVLYFLWYRAIRTENAKVKILIPFILTLAYAISDEIHQSFVLGRTATVRDVGYDTLGMVLAMLRLRQLI